MLPLFGVFVYGLKRSFDFASSNPYAAIMDGAELLQHERIVYATKDAGILIGASPTTESPILQLPVLDPDEQDAPEGTKQKKEQIQHLPALDHQEQNTAEAAQRETT